jgi:hypothetical protein
MSFTNKKSKDLFPYFIVDGVRFSSTPEKDVADISEYAVIHGITFVEADDIARRFGISRIRSAIKAMPQ